MKTALAFILVAALVLPGCASTPTGRTEFQRLADLEQATLKGRYPWTQFYVDAIGIIDTLETGPFLQEMRRHYSEMLFYSRAWDAGKINKDGFMLIQKNLLSKAIATLNTLPRPQAMLIGERQRAAADDWVVPLLTMGALIGGAANALQPPRRAPMVNCVSSQMGAFVNTTCN
jgi:hypothetical protein